MGGLALLVAFLSASQDIVIDAWRVEILAPEQQGPGAGMIQTGYRVAMLVAGAGALIIAAHAGWFAAYATMAALLSIGMLVFLLGPEPAPPPETANRSRGRTGSASPMAGDGGSRALRRLHAAARDGSRYSFSCWATSWEKRWRA